MCHKTYQVFLCDCEKEICTTPCAYAMAHATPVPMTSLNLPSNDARIPDFLRPGHALQHRQSVSSVTSLPAAGAAASKINDSHSSQPAAPAVRTTSLSNFPTPYPRDSIDLAPPPYTHATPSRADLGITEVEMIPSYCAQFFARYSFRSTKPCINCYLKPEFKASPQIWMKGYVDGHPGCKPEDVEELSGVAELRRKQGLVNVAREVNTAESKKVGGLHGETEMERKE